VCSNAVDLCMCVLTCATAISHATLRLRSLLRIRSYRRWASFYRDRRVFVTVCNQIIAPRIKLLDEMATRVVDGVIGECCA
jgi:hypothetical protein